MAPPNRSTVPDWGAMWAPYDESTYEAALAFLRPEMRVLDIGAGDLRFARRAAAMGCCVHAIEQQAESVQRGIAGEVLPANLTVTIADARAWPFPPHLDAAVLLMRHCADYALYVRKLREVGCAMLITNARWRMGVECVLLRPAAPYHVVHIGWFACVCCGATGFVPGDPDRLTVEVEQSITNVEGCPSCAPSPQGL